MVRHRIVTPALGLCQRSPLLCQSRFHLGNKLLQLCGAVASNQSGEIRYRIGPRGGVEQSADLGKKSVEYSAPSTVIEESESFDNLGILAAALIKTSEEMNMRHPHARL